MKTKDKIMLAGGLSIAAYLYLNSRPKQTQVSRLAASANVASSSPNATVGAGGGDVYGIPYSAIAQVGSSLWNGLSSLWAPKTSSADVISNFSSGAPVVPALNLTSDLSYQPSTNFSLLG